MEQIQTERRITFLADEKLFQRTQKIPLKARSEVLRRLLSRLMGDAEKHGDLVYIAVVEEDFKIHYGLGIKNG